MEERIYPPTHLITIYTSISMSPLAFNAFDEGPSILNTDMALPALRCRESVFLLHVARSGNPEERSMGRRSFC